MWPPHSIQKTWAHPFSVHTASHCLAAGGFPSHHPEWLFASRLPRKLVLVSTEEGNRWRCQVGTQRDPQFWRDGSRPGSLELGPAWSGCTSSPRRLPSRNVLQVCPWKLVRLVPHGAGIKYPHMSGLGAMCRGGGMPRCVSASAARSVLSRNLL